MSDVATPDPRSIRIAQDFLARTTARYPVSKALLYGSRARGDAHPESDIDIALIIKGTREDARRMGSLLAGEAIDELLDFGLLISPIAIAEDDWLRPDSFPNPYFLRSVQRDGVPL